MELDLKSDWLVTQIELLKCLHGYEMNGVNHELGRIDYVTSGHDNGKKLLRVIIDPKINVSKANTDTIRTIKASLENEVYDEAVILAEEFTGGAKKLIRKKNGLSYISSNMNRQNSIVELSYAIEKKTWELCRLICGKAPKSESDCKGYQYGEYTCKIRRISDNVDFHAEKRWPWLMMNDFSMLVMLQKEMTE